MIKRLRIKFICVVMAIVMLMLGIMFSVVIHFTGRRMEMESINKMRTIAAGPVQRDNLKKQPDELRLPFFIVEINKHGELLRTSGSYFDLSDQEYVLEIANAALSSNHKTGELNDYHLRYLKDSSPKGYTIIFTDTTSENATLRSLVYSCLLIYFGASAAFLGITIILSHWVIKPVETAWNQQRQFVADASHELKTPLSVIMANAELLQGEDFEPEDRKNFSQNILTMSYQMRTLVENMLNMARVDGGAVQMHMTEVDFSQLVEDATLSVQLLYEEQGMGLNCRIEEGICLRGSEQYLFQVLDVLLDNALKYSRPGTGVEVKLHRSGRSCLLSVAGPGDPIEKEDLKNIFKRFYRVDKARTMNGSYGLGLSIAETVVSAHKGKIWAQSENGCNTFFVQLPVVASSKI